MEIKYIIVEGGDFWSNELGWTEDKNLATRFTQKERDKFNLPLNGKWTLKNDVVVAKQVDDKNSCTINDIEYMQDITSYCRVDDSGQPEYEIDQSDGDFVGYICSNCNTDWSLTAVQTQAQAWKLVKEHING